MKEEIRSLSRGKSVHLPIKSMASVRNYVSEFNAMYFQKKTWKSETNKEKGVVVVTRIA